MASVVKVREVVVGDDRRDNRRGDNRRGGRRDDFKKGSRGNDRFDKDRRYRNKDNKKTTQYFK